ncbi:MAG TPA: serine/threonine transporter SstT [Coriobacteriia bacterium]|nr:serine/threonine transporter SstT [Coriobacteriia bacterium]
MPEGASPTRGQGSFVEVLKKIGGMWNSVSLIKRILIGLVIGIVLGLTLPQGIEPVALMGSIFISALKAVAPVLVFFLVIGSLANAKGDGSMKTILVLYLCSTLTAAIVAVVVSLIFPTALSLTPAPDSVQGAPGGIGEVLQSLFMKIVSNPVEALASANYIGILAWAVVLGIALRAAKDTTKSVLSSVSEAVAKVVRWVISLAPFGIIGIVYSSVAEYGPEIFIEYGQLVLVLVACMLIIALVTNPLLVFLMIRKNPYPLVLRCLKDSGLTAFFTRSSAANIPVNMELCRKLGLNKDTYSVSIPLGATINMAGAAVTIAVMSMAAVYTLGITVDPVSAILLCVLAAVSACGASGVPGGSLLLIPLACSLFGVSNDIAMQVVSVGLIIGVIQDSCETAINSSSDALFTATAEYRIWKRGGKEFTPGSYVSDEGTS